MAEAISYFGWSYTACLEMPARAFFALLKEGRKVHLVDKIENCDIQAISICSAEWYKEIRGQFSNRLYEILGIEEETKQVPDVEPKSPVNTGALSGTEAKSALFSMVSQAKRYN